MNDIAKTSIKDKLITALRVEQLSKTRIGELLGIKPQYLSMCLSPSQWNKFPESTWDILQKWANSGQGIVEYSEKHGRVVPEKKETIKADDIKSDPILVEEAESIKEETEPIIKIRPGVKEARELELKKREARLTNGQLIDLLIEERESLKQKIEAIDVLLKHYIS